MMELSDGCWRTDHGANQPLMTGSEMCTLRLRWGWTQAQLGEFLGYHLQTISRFERGLIEIPVAIDRLMRYEELLREVGRIVCPLYHHLRPFDPQIMQ